MSELDDLFAEAKDRVERSKEFAGQFVEGAKHGASFGYAGEPAPDDLPLHGRVGRIAGAITGSLPGLTALSAVGPAAGLVGGGVVSEAIAGGLYGLISKPEEGESRLKNAVKDAALFGGGAALLHGAGRMFGRGAGKAEEGIAKNVDEISPGAIGSPADLEAVLANRVPAAAPYSTKAGSLESADFTPEELQGFIMGGSRGGETLGRPRRQLEYSPRESFVAESRRNSPAYETLGRPDSPIPTGSIEGFSLGEISPKGELTDRGFAAGKPFERVTGLPPEPRFAQGGWQDLETAILPKDLPAEAMANPHVFAKVMEVKTWDKLIKPWAGNMVRGIDESAPAFKQASLLAEPGNVEAAAETFAKATFDKVIGAEKPVVDMGKNLSGDWAAQWTLQKEIEGLVAKNGLTVTDINQAAQVQEPINFLMSKGANFDDASTLVDKIVERATVDVKPIKPTEILNVAETPAYESIKTRSLSPDEVYDMFFNVPIKGPEALKYGLAVTGPTGDFKLTEKGYDFLRKYNPEFGVPLSQPIKGLEELPRPALGAIRGQGYSNLDLSKDELRKAGLKMPIEKAVKNDIIRPGKTSETWQLTQKGSGMLAGGKGLNANIDLKAYDVAAGRRVLQEDVEGIAKLKLENARTNNLFKDLWEEVTELSTKECDH